MKFILSFFIGALLCFHVSAKTADPFQDALIRQVQERHEKAVMGDKETTKALLTDLEKWTLEQPKNLLLKVYLGSIYTLRSRDIGFGPKAYTYLKNGLKTMDEAVAADPNNLAVRFIRAINNFNLPAFCNRRDNARIDFQTLLTQLDTPNRPQILDTETAQAIYYYAGLSYQQLKDTAQARSAWNRGRDLNPQSTLGIKIGAELAKLKS